MSGSKDRLIIVGCVLACLLPFIDKAFHIDDPMFLWTAQQIHRNLLDFYGFTLNWNGSIQLMSDVMKNPPLASYFIALAAWLFGWGERALHLFFLLPAAGVALGTYALARTFCSKPLLAALAAILSPVFLVSATTVMSDVMMLCGFVWSVVLWTRALATGKQGYFLAAAILIPVAALTKYFGMCLIPLLLVYTVAERRRLDASLLWLLLPLSVLAAYQVYTQALYDRGLLFDAASYAANMGVFSDLKILSKIFVALAFTGGCWLTLLFFAPALISLRTAGAALVAGVVLGFIFFLTGMVETLMAAARSDWKLIQPGPQGLDWGVLVQFCIFILVGAGVLLLSFSDFLRRRDAQSVLLFFWAAGTVLFAGFINWTTNGRSLLPLAPAAGILLARRLEDAKPRLSFGGWERVSLVASAAFAMLVSYADYEHANASRTAARNFTQEYRRYPSTVWVEGHWGFQYYMQHSNAKELDVTASRLYPGDVLLVPYNNC
ncbi:MAG TPA: glycosyltransferase family 39 protein, partial [Thermodesulfobacteriota bacterium]|nr:glycosyltransferase family 39 protein [Thermodesulfobacteriota bacterium]